MKILIAVIIGSLMVAVQITAKPDNDDASKADFIGEKTPGVPERRFRYADDGARLLTKSEVEREYREESEEVTSRYVEIASTAESKEELSRIKEKIDEAISELNNIEAEDIACNEKDEREAAVDAANPWTLLARERFKRALEEAIRRAAKKEGEDREVAAEEDAESSDLKDGGAGQEEENAAGEEADALKNVRDALRQAIRILKQIDGKAEETSVESVADDKGRKYELRTKMEEAVRKIIEEINRHRGEVSTAGNDEGKEEKNGTDSK